MKKKEAVMNGYETVPNDKIKFHYTNGHNRHKIKLPFKTIQNDLIGFKMVKNLMKL